MIGWNVKRLDIDELTQAVAAGFCLLNKLDRAKTSVRLRIVCEPPDPWSPLRFWAEVHTKEEP